MKTGQLLGNLLCVNAGGQELPSEATLIAELREVRRRGLRSLSQQPYPALVEVALSRRVDEAPGQTTALEDALHQAVDRLGEGPLGEAARLTFGFAAGTRGMPSAARRRQAAAVFDLQPETFRKQPERDLLGEVAKELLRYARAISRGHSITQAEAGLVGADSEWLARFESYYRIWSSVSGLRNDLEAALTLHADVATDDDWTEYSDFALFHYASFLVELEDHRRVRGGMWVLGDVQAEQEVAEALHAIQLAAPFNERDESWLRMVIVEGGHVELHAFAQFLEGTDTGPALMAEWQTWLLDCSSQPDALCPVHDLLASCARYLETIEAAWSASRLDRHRT